ncbi:MAG: hypothetical protein RLZZ196_704 [Bacteroidota bacterium]|jgi:hypothetical protein
MIMFKRIAEWITGHKRSETKHPLDYIDRKAEEMYSPKTTTEPVVEQPVVESAAKKEVAATPSTPAKKPRTKKTVEAAPEVAQPKEKVKKPAPAKKVSVKKAKKVAS